MEHLEPTHPAYINDKEAMLKRLRRIEGQVRGIQKMVDDERYCIDILTQISAVDAGLDKVALNLLESHANHCVMGANEDDQEAKVREMMAAVRRLLRHG